MKNFDFWQKWLTWANVAAIVVGIITAFAGNSIILAKHNELTQQVFLQGKTFPQDVLLLKNWLFGIIGGTIVGFHILMIMISENAFRKKEKWAYYSICLGLLSWFIIDSGISIYYKAIHNLLIINIPALLIISLPLIMTRNEFKDKK